MPAPVYFRRESFPSAYRFFCCFLAASVAAILCASIWAARVRPVLAQNQTDQPGEEVVANLAAGRLIIAVVKDAILVGTVEDPFESQTHPPMPVALPNDRAGVLLGAIDWFSPSSQMEIARLDRELPRLRGHVKAEGPRLQAGEEGKEATDIEFVGQGLWDRLNQVVKDLHAKMDLAEGEPIVELVLADVVPTYGPEVWHMNYSIEQFPQRGEFWETRVQHPHYVQDWPPEKGQPLTLIEFRYPPDDTSPTVLEMLRQNDPRLEKLATSDPAMASVASMLLKGISNKIATEDGTQFMRAVLNALAPPKARETMAVIGFKTGFSWVLPPPNEPKKPTEHKERPPDAPSLLKPTGN